MEKEQNLMEVDLLSLNKNQLKEAFKDLKRVDEIFSSLNFEKVDYYFFYYPLL